MTDANEITPPADVASVRLTQIDGALPNLALMKLAHWHRAKGDTVTLTRQIERERSGEKHVRLQV